MSTIALQDTMPHGTCYGCGPANEHGLQIKSFWSDDGQFVIAMFDPQAKHNAGFPNVMYGGLVASLIDCHSIWTAIAFRYRQEGRRLGSAPMLTYVTGELNVKYRKPTPLDQTIHLKAWVKGHIDRKMRVLCELGTAETVTATASVVAVQIDADKSIGA